MKQKPAPKARNPLHDHPLLRKGSVHEKTGKARRRAGKVDLRREWGPHSARQASATPAPLAPWVVA